MIYALLITVIAIFTSCEKDDANSVESQACSNMLYFDSEEELVAEMNNVAKMTLGEKVQWEKSKGFNSIEIAAEKLYKSINPDNFKSKEEIVSFVEKNSNYLKLTLDGNGEYEIDTQLDESPFKYLANDKCVFQVKDSVFKVFNEGIIAVPEEKCQDLINSNFETALLLANSSNESHYNPSLKSVTSSCPPGTTARSDEGDERVRLKISAYWEYNPDFEMYDDLGTSAEVRAYNRVLGIWFQARRTLSMSINIDFRYVFTPWAGEPSLVYGKTEYTYSEKEYVIYSRDCAGLSYDSPNVELVSFNCWAEQPNSGRAYAICSGN